MCLLSVIEYKLANQVLHSRADVKVENFKIHRVLPKRFSTEPTLCIHSSDPMLKIKIKVVSVSASVYNVPVTSKTAHPPPPTPGQSWGI